VRLAQGVRVPFARLRRVELGSASLSLDRDPAGNELQPSSNAWVDTTESDNAVVGPHKWVVLRAPRISCQTAIWAPEADNQLELLMWWPK